jgi:2-polyprenyl-3-methyl-5-hydroxy-6-metoxy-1,4-benzoquinol methylase
LKLEADGLNRIVIARTLESVMDRFEHEAEGWRLAFNHVYRSCTPGFPLEPNAFLVATARSLQPGCALDINMGQGRNSAFLASLGWHVTGFDISEAGIAAARSHARAQDLSFRASVCHWKDFTYGQCRWDLIVSTYNPVPITEPSFVRKLKRSLKPNGVALVESFAYDEMIWPRRVGVEIDPDKLLAAFNEFEILHFTQIVTIPDWRQELSPVVRLLARRIGEQS